MPNHPENHHRRSIRLKGYDYSQEGLYFITICVQDRECLFGDIVVVASLRGCPEYDINGCPESEINGFPNSESGKNGCKQMILNDAGIMVERWYRELENKYPDKRCHEMVIMPNHFHCIIENMGNGFQTNYGLQTDNGFKTDDGSKLDGYSELGCCSETGRPRRGAPTWAPCFRTTTQFRITVQFRTIIRFKPIIRLQPIIRLKPVAHIFDNAMKMIWHDHHFVTSFIGIFIFQFAIPSFHHYTRIIQYHLFASIFAGF